MSGECIVSEEYLEVRPLFDVRGEGARVAARQPTADRVHVVLRAPRPRRLLNIELGERSGSAAGRAADRPLQPVVRPPSLTHIAQVRSSWTVNDFVNPKLRPRLVQVLEEAPPTAEQYWCRGNFQFVNGTHDTGIAGSHPLHPQCEYRDCRQTPEPAQEHAPALH